MVAIDSSPSFPTRRKTMVEQQLRARGIVARRVLQAMGRVRREGYVPSYLGKSAYDDSPLPIGEGQTISQPYIVAFMLEALDLRGDEKVLEIGTGSGYAAAVLAEVAREVFTIERHERLANTARQRLVADGYTNVHVRHGDGTLGWPEQAPFDAIVVAAGGPAVPESLRQQLTIGGRMVIPVGEEAGRQQLVRITRKGEGRWEEERLANVRFVPLIGREGWQAPANSTLVAEAAEPFTDVERADLEPLRERIHGTGMADTYPFGV